MICVQPWIIDVMWVLLTPRGYLCYVTLHFHSKAALPFLPLALSFMLLSVF
jgi:hypothetical protein